MTSNELLEYDPADFHHLPQVLNTEPKGGEHTVAVDPSLIEEVDLDALKFKHGRTPKVIKALALIREGENGQYDGDRSKAVNFICCELIRQGISDQAIVSILLDKRLGISEHTYYEKNGVPRKEPFGRAKRDLKSAHKEVEAEPATSGDKVVDEINEVFSMVKEGGKVKILVEDYDPTLDRKFVSRMSVADFKNLLINQKVVVDDGKLIDKGTYWLKHPGRRTYMNGVIFDPDPERQAREGWYNLYRGFSCEALPGNWDLMKDHMLMNLCKGNGKYFRYLLFWMAFATQFPHLQPEVALVLRGEYGTGKGLFARMFGELFGGHFMQVTNSSHFVGNFNKHMQDLLVLFMDEAFCAGDKKQESIAKSIITEKTIVVEGKGLDAITARNYIHVIMASNADWVVPARKRERRYFVLDVADEKAQDKAYFKAIVDQMNNGGREAMLFELLNIDLGDFHPRDFPATEALINQKIESLDEKARWLFDILHEGVLPGGWGGKNANICSKRDLQEHYVNSIRWLKSVDQGTQTSLGQYLKKVFPLLKPGRKKDSQTRPNTYEFPDLATCRKNFDDYYEIDGGWDEWENWGLYNPDAGDEAQKDIRF